MTNQGLEEFQVGLISVGKLPSNRLMGRSLLDGIAHFGIWGRKFREIGILKWEDFYFIKFNQCFNSFQDDLIKKAL